MPSEQIFNFKLSLLKIIHDRIAPVPMLLILGIEMIKYINKLEQMLIEFIIVLFLTTVISFFIPLLVISIKEKNYLKNKFKTINITCHICDQKADINLIGFSKKFFIPLCEQHKQFYKETPRDILKDEQEIYIKYNNKIVSVTISITFGGLIIISLVGLIFGYMENGQFIGIIIILILILILVPYQLFVLFNNSVKMVNLIKTKLLKNS